MSVNEDRLNEFLQKTTVDLAAGYAGVMIGLGHKLGLYKAMANNGPLTSSEVARRSGCAERYVREWLNSQAAGGYVVYHSRSETYELTPEQAAVLADEESPVFLPAAWEVPASMWMDEHMAIHAFRTGTGIGWRDHHERLFRGVAAFFRNSYRASLVSSWLPALDGVVGKLQAGARVADVGCGFGHSTIIMAKSFPNSSFVGFDSHPASLEAARENARQAGLGEQVRFELADARSFPPDGYDLITFFDCLHDMGDPVGAARQAARALKPDGTVMLIEPFAKDRVEDNLNPVGLLYYAASTTICCAHALSEDGGTALGAQAGERRLENVFKKAGFGSFRRAAETPFNLILEARL